MKIIFKHYPFSTQLGHRVEETLATIDPAPNEFVEFCNKIGSWPESIVYRGKFFIISTWEGKTSAVYEESHGFIFEEPRFIAP